MVRGKKWIDYIERTRKSIRTQVMQKPSMYSPETWVSQWTPYYFTENKIGQTLSRVMAWDDVNKRWLLSRCDSSGNLYVRQFTLENEAKDVTLFTSVVVPSKGLVTHAGEDISGYSKKELLVSTTGLCTVYVQFSDDNENWYTWHDTGNVQVDFSINNAKKAWEIIDHSHYVRIIIYNSGAASATVTARLLCQV